MQEALLFQILYTHTCARTRRKSRSQIMTENVRCCVLEISWLDCTCWWTAIKQLKFPNGDSSTIVHWTAAAAFLLADSLKSPSEQQEKQQQQQLPWTQFDLERYYRGFGKRKVRSLVGGLSRRIDGCACVRMYGHWRPESDILLLIRYSSHRVPVFLFWKQRQLLFCRHEMNWIM